MIFNYNSTCFYRRYSVKNTFYFVVRLIQECLTNFVEEAVRDSSGAHFSGWISAMETAARGYSREVILRYTPITFHSGEL